MSEYAVIPMQPDARIIYTDDIVAAWLIFSDMAQAGRPVALGRKHDGNDKPSNYYDTIGYYDPSQQAKM